MKTDVPEQTHGPMLWGVKVNAYSPNAFGHICIDIHLCRMVGHSSSPFDAHAVFPKAREQKGRLCLRRALAEFFFSECRFNTLGAFIPSRPLVSVL